MKNFWENENFYDFQKWYVDNAKCTAEQVIEINESPHKYKKEYWAWVYIEENKS
tara:strand:+ start:49 stop:210 length:162 start_codon:yes stop_codon:yes gene_type:complete